MRQAHIRKEKVLARRAARARRSQWLSRVIMTCCGIAAVIVMRLHPEAVAGAIVRMQDMAAQSGVAKDLSLPQVRSMPLDKVTVRRAGSTAQTAGTASADAQSQADALGNALQNIKAGG